MSSALLSHRIFFSILQPYKKVIWWNAGSKDNTISVSSALLPLVEPVARYSEPFRYY